MDPKTGQVGESLLEDNDLKWMMDDDEWDDLWQNSAASSFSATAAANANANTNTRVFKTEAAQAPKRPPDTASPHPRSSKHLKTDESVLLWSDSNPSWLDAAEAAAALKDANHDDDNDDDHNYYELEEEAFPAGQGFDLCTPTHPPPPAMASTPMPSAADLGVGTSTTGWSWPSPPWMKSSPLLSTSQKKSRTKKAAKPASSKTLANLSWSDLVARHADLMAQKGKIDS